MYMRMFTRMLIRCARVLCIGFLRNRGSFVTLVGYSGGVTLLLGAPHIQTKILKCYDSASYGPYYDK